MRVLLVAPDRCDALAALLTDGGHEVEVSAVSGALEMGDLESRCDLVILSPGTGDALRRLRSRSATLPILALTPEGLVEDRVAALEAGADDALSVPFAASQMSARVNALGRRARLVPRPPAIVECDGCCFDLDRGRASRGGTAIELARREVEILRWLHRHRTRAVTRKELLEHVFGVSPEVETRAVDMAIAVLRKKIERDPKAPRIVISRMGVGYAWGAGGDLTGT